MIDQRLAHDKLTDLMRDPTGEVAELALRLDVLDTQIWDERFLQYQETKAKLDALGIDTTRFSPPPRPARAEQRSTRHFGASDDIGELIAAAKEESPLDRLYREHLADTEPVPDGAPLLRRYFKPPRITIR